MLNLLQKILTLSEPKAFFLKQWAGTKFHAEDQRCILSHCNHLVVGLDEGIPHHIQIILPEIGNKNDKIEEELFPGPRGENKSAIFILV